MPLHPLEIRPESNVQSAIHYTSITNGKLKVHNAVVVLTNADPNAMPQAKPMTFNHKAVALDCSATFSLEDPRDRKALKHFVDQLQGLLDAVGGSDSEGP